MNEGRPSKKQIEVLNYIDRYIKDHGYAPSLREIARAFNIKSVSTPAAHVDALIALGYLRKRENSARSLQVVNPEERAQLSEGHTSHLDWLHQEIAKREADDKLSDEVRILKAALSVLDQSEEK